MSGAKRLFDLLWTVVGLALLWPVFVGLSLIIALGDGGPVLYRQARVGKGGRVFRMLKLDELPQLWNVLRGEMSLVGPRPEVPRYVALYTAEQWRVLDLVPGITDRASIKYRDESELLARASDPQTVYVSQILPDKIRLNLEYAAHATVWTDFLVVLSTLGHMVRPAPRSGAEPAPAPGLTGQRESVLSGGRP